MRCIDQMLEVVEDEQKSAVADAVGEAVPRFERLSGDLEHELRVAQRSKRSPEDAVGVLVGRFRGRLEREPGLAGSGRTGQRQQARDPASEQGRHLAELSLAPEESRRRNREVRLLQASQRWEGFAAELIDPFRCGEVLQAVFAEVAQVLLSSTSDAVEDEIRIWPPCPAAAMRAARWTSAPT